MPMRIALVVPGGVDRSARERVIPALLWLIERPSVPGLCRSATMPRWLGPS